MKFTKTQQKFINKVRNDSRIGRGTCSSVDECLSDSDIAKMVKDYGVAGAWQALLESEDIFDDGTDDADYHRSQAGKLTTFNDLFPEGYDAWEESQSML